MNRMWEIREHDGYRSGHRMGMKEWDKSHEEAYECGYEDGYEAALDEQRYGERSSRIGRRRM